jgi:hypothetical protein
MKLVLAIAALGAALAFSGTAAADPPIREVLTAEPITSTACGFDVLIEPTQKVTLTTFSDGHRLLELASGSVRLRMTSATGSIQLNVSGPSMFRETSPGTFTFGGAGPWLIFDHPFVNLPPIAYITGQITFSDEGPSVLVTGRVVDVCALLS